MQFLFVVALLTILGAASPLAIAPSARPSSGLVLARPTSSSPNPTSPTTLSKREDGRICSDISMSSVGGAQALASDCGVIGDYFKRGTLCDLEVLGNRPLGFKVVRYNTCGFVVWADADRYTIGNIDMSNIISAALDSFTTSDGIIGAIGHMTCDNAYEDNVVPGTVNWQSVNWQIVRWLEPATYDMDFSW